MKGDLPAAAFRLMAQLPVRTVERRVKARPSVWTGPGAGHTRQLIYKRKRYDTIAEACKALGYTKHELYKLLSSGAARYA